MAWHLGRPEIQGQGNAVGCYAQVIADDLDGDEDLDIGDKVWLRVDAGVWQGAEVAGHDETIACWYLKREEEYLYLSSYFR